MRRTQQSKIRESNELPDHKVSRVNDSKMLIALHFN